MVQELDVVARRLIRASEEGLRRWLGVPQLENDLLGTLYLRVREVLGQANGSDEDALIEDVTLTIYLTASAWHSRDESPVQFLSSLHEVIAKTIPHTDARRIS